jgi:hypothetical protein
MRLVSLATIDRECNVAKKKCKRRKGTSYFGSELNPENCELTVNFCEQILNQYIRINSRS